MKKIKTSARKFFILSKLIFLPSGLAITSCNKNNSIIPASETQVTYEPEYSTVSNFTNALKQVDLIVNAKHITAYMDTLSNGYPNSLGIN